MPFNPRQFHALDAATDVFLNCRTMEFHRYVNQVRRIWPETADTFRVGYAPPWPAFERPLLYRPIFESISICTADGTPRNPNSIVFPYLELDQDHDVRTYSFIFRTLDPSDPEQEDEPETRYLNLPNRREMIYPPFSIEKQTFYGLPGWEQNEEVILVEGPFDAMRCYQAGFPNTVAMSGLGTEKRLFDLLARTRIRRAYLFFDHDRAGIGKAFGYALTYIARYAGRVGYDLCIVVGADGTFGLDPGDMTEDQVRQSFTERTLTPQDFVRDRGHRAIDPNDHWQHTILDRLVSGALGDAR